MKKFEVAVEAINYILNKYFNKWLGYFRKNSFIKRQTING